MRIMNSRSTLLVNPQGGLIMKQFLLFCLIAFAALQVAFSIVFPSTLWADERSISTDRQKIAAAVERGVALVEKSARSYPTHRKCFACHHQTMPLLAIGESRKARIK